MKTTSKFLITAICTLFFNSFNIMGQTIDTLNENTLCLEMKGKVLKTGKPSTHTYKVVLIHDNTVVETVEVKDNRSFKFTLTADTYYAIKIYKTGYAPKLISISTHIPEEKFKNNLFRFHFTTNLIPETEFVALNEDSKDFPIALVSFSKSIKKFNYNEKYTSNIKSSLYSDITVPKY